MELWTARYKRLYSGGLAVVLAATKERAVELLKDDNHNWDEPSLILKNIDTDFEGVIDSDYYSE